MRVRLNHTVLADLISKGQLSQNHWAIKLGLSSGHLADLVNGRHPFPSAATREKLLQGLDVAFDVLFDIEGPNDHGPSYGDFRSRLEAALSDRYLIDDVIGQGGMGTVFGARDVKHGRPVALKVVLPDAIAALGNTQFLAEIRRTASLQHPNILPLLDSGVGAECPYLVTPRVRDGSLRDLMDRRGAMSSREALQWLRGICLALAYAHRQRLVHCDIKPDNVLISSEQAVVTDFGISRAIHLDGRRRDRTIDTSSGTPAYVSPEQVSGEPVDDKSDQYSVACMAFEMLSGRPPFSGENDMAVVAQRFLDDPPDIRTASPSIPYSVATVLRRGMARDARRRFVSIEHFLDAFEHAAQVTQRSVLERTEDAVLGGIHHIRDWLRHKLVPTGARHLPAVQTAVNGNGHWPMTNFVQDIRFATRLLTRQPMFTIVAVLTLGLGIGANTAIFSVINGFLLTPLPYPDPHQLVTLWEVNESGNTMHVAGANFEDWRGQSRSFDVMATHPSLAFGGPTTVLGGNQPARVLVAGISEGFFNIFRILPAAGRLFTEADFSAGTATTVVVSHRFWQTQLSADPALSRHALQLSGASLQVVGVTPPGFRYPDETDVWVPVDPVQSPNRTSHNWAVVARLRDGVSVQEAQIEMSGLGARLKTAFGEDIDAIDVRVTGLQDELVGPLRRPLQILLGASLMVLLVACTNIASTLLAQGITRQRELAIRGAMGARRGRLIRQLLAENMLLAIFGTVVGIGLSLGIVRALTAVAPPGLAINDVPTMDGIVIAGGVIAAVAATLVFGLYPALKATRTDIGLTLRSGDRGNAAQHSSWSWRTIVGGEVALALTLLVGAALLIRSFWEIMHVDPGFDPRGVVTADISLPSATYPDDTALAAYYRAVESALRSVPGVQSVGIINHIPLGGASISGALDIEGWDHSELPYADYRVVNGAYFQAMGIPIVRGRTFDEGDRAGNTPVALINQQVAQRYWPGDNPVGRRIRNLRNDSWLYPDEWITIVGVVGNVRHDGLTRDAGREVYVHVAQRPFRARSAIIALRASRVSRDFGDTVREAMRRVDADVPIALSSMEAYIQTSVSDHRFTTLVLGTFAACALALAMVGIYGVVSYSVAQRTREMGLRIALGAEPHHVRQAVQRNAMATVSLGVVAGVAGSFVLSRIIQNLLFSVSPTDPAVFAGVAVIILGAAWLASLVPAMRSTRVDPIVTMREE
jgi:putative ABC transport system permease protein